MTKYNITISCKEKKTLKQIFQFLALQYQAEIKKLQTPLYFNQKKTKIKKITVLKSPHVYKTAQRHFEYRIYSTKLQIQSYRPKKYFFMLKKLQNHVFPEVKITINKRVNHKNTHSLLKNKFFVPNNYKIGFITTMYNSHQNLKFKYKNNINIYRNNFASLNKKTFRKMIDYIQVFDHYGN